MHVLAGVKVLADLVICFSNSGLLDNISNPGLVSARVHEPSATSPSVRFSTNITEQPGTRRFSSMANTTPTIPHPTTTNDFLQASSTIFG